MVPQHHHVMPGALSDRRPDGRSGMCPALWRPNDALAKTTTMPNSSLPLETIVSDTYQDVRRQIGELEVKAAELREKEAANVLARIKQEITDFGFSAADLGFPATSPAASSRRTVRATALQPRYRDPNTGKTWNGHGKRPFWIIEAQSAGLLDSLLIGQPTIVPDSPKPKQSRKLTASPIPLSTPIVKKAEPASPQRSRTAKPATKATAAKPAAKTRKPTARKPAAKTTKPKSR